MTGDRDALLTQFSALVAQDLGTLAALHDRELDAGTVAQLQAMAFPDNLALCLRSARAQAAAQLMRASLIELDGLAPHQLDELAVDYAAIYLTHTLRAAPEESVWLDEEELAMQAPMFEVRDLMSRHGLAVPNWRLRPDDHLVNELLFLAHLLGIESPLAAFTEAASFLDRHLMMWVGDFANRAAARCATPFYAALNALTASYLDELRDLLADIIGKPRPTAAEMKAQIERERHAQAAPNTAPLRYVPGLAPSW